MAVVSSDLKIMVVEDTLSIQQMVKQQLRSFGFTTNLLGANDVPSAKKILEEHKSQNPPVQFIISDWNMPGESGFDLLKYVRATDPYKELPFLMLTTNNEQSKILEAIQAGADNYLLKPWTIDDLKTKFNLVLKKRMK